MASSSPAEDTGAPNSDSIIIIPEEEYTGPIEDAVGAPVGPLPSVSSRINFDTSRIPPTVDLWVVGAGILGSLAAKQYRSLYPNAKIIAETRTEASHADLLEAGITPRLRSDRSQEDDFCARNVLISLPPSSLKTAEEYQEELAASCRLYNSNQYNSAVTEKRAEEEGNLVFTSSTVVYGDSFGNTVNETFRVDSRSSRSFNMICAEQAVLTRGGSVLR